MLPPFAVFEHHVAPLPGGVGHEVDWMAAVAGGAPPSAHWWHSAPGWVVPRSYTAYPGWESVAQRPSLPVQVRASGGGLVPQGPGIWNLSLVWAADVQTPADSTAVYRGLCQGLAQAFRSFGVEAQAAAVPGSFCDGRYNLAVAGRKLVGTAQSWRRLQGRQVVLAHAVVLLDAPLADLVEQGNALERAWGGETRYSANAMTTLRAVAGDGADLESRMVHALRATFSN